MRRTALRTAIALALAVMFAGCATQRPPSEPAETEHSAAERARRMLEADRPLAAVRVYRDQAERSEGATAQRWRLRIVEVLFDRDYPELALDWLQRLEARPVPEELQLRAAVVQARAAVFRRQGVRALRLLPDPARAPGPELRTRILAIRADAYAMTGRAGRALADRIRRERLLDTPAAIDANHEAIWTVLRGLPAARIEELAATEAAPILQGWAELALAARRARSGDAAVRATLEKWRGRFPDHPANERFVASIAEQVRAALTYPERIALLLPLSGALAESAGAVRDGLMAGYYAQPERIERPRITVYDTGDQGLEPAEAYRRAADAGADFVIGPLRKPAVAAIAALGERPAPVLSLNYLPGDAPDAPDKLYQFGLLPEDEARQAADAAVQNEHFNAVALVPAGEWGTRMVDAFRERFESLGGTVLEVSRYNSKASDHGRVIKRLLNLDSSYRRERLLQSRIGREVRFEPRRRQDVEVIFMAAMPRQARLLEPQLEFHRAGDLPVYATSHVFTGSEDQEADWDLNGLYFTELPWILDNLDEPDGLYRRLVEYWPGARERHTRLYALGIDAFALLPHLDRLARRDAIFNGRTGHLSLDDRNRLHRQLRWAVFVEGRPAQVPRPEAEPAGGEALGEDVRERAGDS